MCGESVALSNSLVIRPEILEKVKPALHVAILLTDSFVFTTGHENL